MSDDEALKTKLIFEACKRLFLSNSFDEFDEYISKVKNLFDIPDILGRHRDEIIKCLEYYNRFLLKNRSKIENFPKKYYESCKYIIKLDFIKGYYNLLVITKCNLDSKNLNSNIKYIEKFYYKFTYFLDNSSYDNSKSNLNRIVAIKNSYSNFKKENTKIPTTMHPIKRYRDLAQEDMTEGEYRLKEDMKKYKSMISDPKKQIPMFLYHFPDDVNMKILSSLTSKDFLELRCANSLVNKFICGMYLHRMDDFYKNIMIDNDDSFKKFVRMIGYFKVRASPIEKLTFDFDSLSNDKALTIEPKAIQKIINLIKVKELCIINHGWTILNILPFNIVSKHGYKLEKLHVKIGKIINDNYRFLENSLVLFTGAFLQKLAVEYINMVYIKEVPSIGIKSTTNAIQSYDGSILRRQEISALESLEIISFLDTAMFPLLNKYTKNKIFMELFIKFDEVFNNLKEITLRNFSIFNMNSLFTYITDNPLRITKLELLRIPALPRIPKLFLLLKDLNNLKTFSLHSSSNLRYTFTSINNFILIKNIYDTNEISDEFLERFVIIPTWPKLEELTLIETSINKPILKSLLNENIRFLCLNDNLNLKYMPAERVSELNFNLDIPKYFITDFGEFYEVVPKLEVFSLNNLDFDMHSTFLTHNTNIFYKSLFKMNLKTLDVSMNQSFCLRLFDFLRFVGLQAEIDDLKVRNLVYDDFFNQDQKLKQKFEQKMKILNLVTGIITNKIRQFKNDNDYVCWYRSCVLNKYQGI